MNIYVDTNILVDLVCERTLFIENARKIFALGYANKVTLTISALSFVNTVYIGKKYGYVDVKEQLKKISQFVNVVDLKGHTVTWTLSCNWNDYEDAVQCESASFWKADCIVTRNKKDFSQSPIPVYTTEELLKIFHS